MRIPTVTRKEMADVDRKAFTYMGITRLMENAGYRMAEFTRYLLKEVKGKEVMFLIGKGNNGGDGLCCARHLHNWGAKVTILMASKKIGAQPKEQLKMLKGMKIKYATKIGKPDLIWDCLIGYNLKGNPRKPFDKIITMANESKTGIVACDTPSGLDVTSGKAFTPCIKAAYTLTLALPKTGLLKSKQTGKLFVADIGIPPSMYKKKVPALFSKKSIIEVKV